MKEFKANEYITLRNEENQTIIYINGERFDQCFRLLFNIPINETENFEDIESIDEVIDTLENPPVGEDNLYFEGDTEFWAHCSNIQAWVDYNYDTRLLHRNLAFPLLKKLTEIGDLLAKRVFKEEIAKRLLSGYGTVILYLFNEGYLDYFEKNELDSIMEEIQIKDIFDYFPIISSYEDEFKPLLNDMGSDILNDYNSLKVLLESIRTTYDYLIKEGRRYQFKPVKKLYPENFVYLDEEDDYIEGYHDTARMEFTYRKNRITGISLCNRLWKNYEKFPNSLGNFPKLEILDLSGCYLKASTFPKDLTNLKSLKELYLQYNELESIPQAFFQFNSLIKIVARQNKIKFIDDSIGNLILLEELILDENWLKFLPESIGNLSNLKKLDLERNSLEKLPESLGKLHNLVELNLSYAFSSEFPEGELDSLPGSFNQLKNLKILDISGNCWEEGILESISDLPMLEKLTMDPLNIPHSFKNLSGLKELYIYPRPHGWHIFPKPITALPSLEKLYIRYLMARELPESFGDLKNLTYLSLRNGHFESLPESFGNLVLLEELDLSHNHHLSNLPESFGNLLKLKKINLNSDCLSNLPESFGKLKSLRELYLDSCRLTSLPDSFGYLMSLEELRLRENELETLPDSFGNLTSLKFLDLSKNPLVSLPNSFGNLSSLKTLYILGLSDYELEQRYKYYGPISQKRSNLSSLPKFFGNLESLETLKIIKCNLESLPESIGKLKSLKRLELHRNKIKVLPESFGNLQSLESLNLSSNDLIKLPNSIGNLKSLRTLNVAQNKLENLPITISELKKLKNLDLGGNFALKNIAMDLFKYRGKKNSIYIK